MSIVEKAAEKLKRMSSDSGAVDASDTPPASSATPAIDATSIERVQERIHAVEPAQPHDVPALHVDMRRLGRMGMIPGEARDARRLTDELRRIKRPLLKQIGSHAAKSGVHTERILITSSVPGEGKTFTAINLALSLAREPDFEVLLIDGDIPKANITQALGLQGREGLMDLLVNPHMRAEDVIVRTDIPDFMVVPTGKHNTLTAELLGGKRMQQVLQVLSNPERQRLLVFDSAPLLATSEAQVLASHVGQVLMIVASGRTRRQEVKAAMQHLEGTPNISFVLNKSRLPASESHYYDNYYGNYHGHDASSRPSGEA